MDCVSKDQLSRLSWNIQIKSTLYSIQLLWNQTRTHRIQYKNAQTVVHSWCIDFLCCWEEDSLSSIGNILVTDPAIQKQIVTYIPGQNSMECLACKVKIFRCILTNYLPRPSSLNNVARPALLSETNIVWGKEGRRQYNCEFKWKIKWKIKWNADSE